MIADHDLPQPPIRKTDGWKHQLAGYHFAYPMKAAYVGYEMGCGKTWVAINLIANRGHQFNLILCPVSVRDVWRREFAKHCGVPIEVLILDKGTASTKAALVKQRVDAAKIDGTRLAVVVNYESAAQPALATELLRRCWDMVCCDEAHKIKSPGGVQSRFVARLRSVAKHRLCLSGTPMPHSPLDIYAQFRFLDPDVFGTNYALFRNRYAVCDQQFPSKVLRWLNQDELCKKFYSRAIRVKSADVLDLPEIMHIERTFTLPAAAVKVYRELENELIADVGPGVVVTPNALVKLLRLQQITSGFAPIGGGETAQTIHELHGEKEKLLAELLDDLPTDEPVVVFCRFTRDLAAVKRVAESQGRRYGELSGRANCLTDHAQMPTNVDVLGVQIQSGGVGIDLTRAAYAVYFSIGYSLGEYEQSVARLHRPGQLRPVRIYHLIAAGTVDRSVYAAIRKRKDVVEAVLSCMVKKTLDQLELDALEAF